MFSAKMTAFQRKFVRKCNVPFNVDVISFEQLGPDFLASDLGSCTVAVVKFQGLYFTKK